MVLIKLYFFVEIKMKKIFSLIIAVMLTVSLCLISLPISAEGEVDKSELEALIAEANDMRQEDYDATSIQWISFRNMLGIVEGVYEDETVDQVEVDSAVANLRSRIDALGPKRSTETTGSTESADVQEIKSLLSEARAMNRIDYSVSDYEWEALQAQIELTREAIAGGDEATIISMGNKLYSIVESVKASKNTEGGMPVVTQPSQPQESYVYLDSADEDKVVIVEKEEKVMPKSTAPFSKGGFIYLGCGSTVAASALVVVGVIGAVLAFKKKED